MNKKILFLYFTPSQKSEFLRCEPVFKAILRKFRKTATFSYMQIDLSPTCRDVMKENLIYQIKLSDAVILNGNSEETCEEAKFAKSVLGLFSTEYFIAGRCICFPAQLTSVSNNGEAVTESISCYTAGIKETVKLCIKEAIKRRQKITVCTDSENGIDNTLFREFEYALGENRHLSVNHVTPREMIWQCITRIPFPDTVLTTENMAKIIAMHTTAFQKAPDGYILHQIDGGRIYRRQFFHGEHTTSRVVMSLILAFAAVLENEFVLSNAAFWLRRSVSLAFNEYGCAPESEFLNKVISEINKPMRKSRGTHNESANQ